MRTSKIATFSIIVLAAAAACTSITPQATPFISSPVTPLPGASLLPSVALPSIAAVSRFVLTTRTADAIAAYRVVVVAGREAGPGRETGAKVGTPLTLRSSPSVSVSAIEMAPWFGMPTTSPA